MSADLCVLCLHHVMCKHRVSHSFSSMICVCLCACVYIPWVNLPELTLSGVVHMLSYWYRLVLYSISPSPNPQPPWGYVASLLNDVSCCTQDELPEALLGAVRLQNLDLSSAAVLDLETGHITRKS